MWVGSERGGERILMSRDQLCVGWQCKRWGKDTNVTRPAVCGLAVKEVGKEC